MKKTIAAGIFVCFLIFAVIFTAGCIGSAVNGDGNTINITDAAGRNVTIPDNPQKIAVSSPGSTRYFAWLQVTDRITAVDLKDSSQFVISDEARPYMLANPEIKNHPSLGSSGGKVDPETLMLIKPDVLFMIGVSDTKIRAADTITEKTGIPVVLFYSGNYVTHPDEVAQSLRLIAKILHAEDRAEAVIKYFNDVNADLEARVADIPDEGKPSVYVGGVAYSGDHGMTGTDPTYYEFTVLHANNAAEGLSTTSSTGFAEISKEEILKWDPDIIFIDLNTFAAAGGGAVYELKNDDAYKGLSAVKTGQVYAVNPHTSFGTNHETCMANAYFIGKILYPEQFSDIDPILKADEIYTFMDGAPVFDKLKANMYDMSYQKIEV